MMSLVVPARNDIESNFQSVAFEDRLENITLVIEKIQRISKEQFLKIIVPMIKYWIKEFKEESYSKSTLKILALPVYAGLLGIGGLTSYASVNLMINSGVSDALSSDVSTRLTYANNITNVGALFACITDLPAISYVLYRFVFEKAYRSALHDSLDLSYRTSIEENLELSDAMHEEIYQSQLSILQGLEFDDYYRDPDLHSETGRIHEELAPILAKIDEEIGQGVPLSDLAKKCIEEFKNKSCSQQLGTITAGTIALSAMALASFLVLENIIILKDSSLGDLSYGDQSEQINEAMEVTQLGGLFSSITAFGVAIYLFLFAFLKTPYNKIMHKKIDDIFAKHRQSLGNMTSEMRNELHRIKVMKMGKSSWHIL